MTYAPVPLPEHLPEQLTITLWDFTWFTRTGPGEPFEDLDRAFAEAVERGYNTIRICAMPFYLFRSGLDTRQARFGPLGGGYGQGTRWYDVRHRSVLDARAHLLQLFRAAQRHGVFVIVSSWEYQQTSSFSGDRRWFDALMRVPAEERALVMAEAHADLYEHLDEHGLSERVAFVELHNEVQAGYLTEGLPGQEPAVVELEERLSRALAAFRRRLPQVPVTVNYSRVPVDAMRGIPREIDVAVFHPYVYGVLEEQTTGFALRDPARFSTERVRPLLRPDAPDYEQWQPPAEDLWRKEATIVGKPEIYVHDWADPRVWDLYLYERYSAHHTQMVFKLSEWIDIANDFARGRGIPLVFGEGWLGYTPLRATFEEGPIGAQYCRRAAAKARAVGARGSIVCSNAAPHHPMWADQALQVQCNAIFTGRSGFSEDTAAVTYADHGF
ncbi:cellulase-like family protein [Kineococcus sp. SYSU DK005]|uniref:cellulase-like family protein n=1 Tax=Kineococcus sp. SYSU DK005 TaxID=3383126 RepID=UPI003D7E85FE